MKKGLWALQRLASQQTNKAVEIGYANFATSSSLDLDKYSKILPRSDAAYPRKYSSPAQQRLIVEELAAAPQQVPVPEYPLNGGGSLGADVQFKGLNSDIPCLARAHQTGPEPEYHKVVSGFKTFHHDRPFHLMHSEGVLPELNIAYETWGELNEKKDNVILLCTGLSASSHAKSHEANEKPGWWEKFIGPGCALDTNEYFVVCSNNLGGCYGTTGPSSINPLTDTHYGTTFPIITVEDMVHAKFLLLDHLGVDKLYAVVGSSLGGMQSLAAAVLYPHRVGKAVSISACASTHPTAIVLRYLQRKAIMMDPQWQRGHYYTGDKYPSFGMKLAREIGTITYRSGPEWDQRFGRRRIKEGDEPTLCPHFMIESYLEYQGEQFCKRYDPNSILYLSKAMDLFDLSETHGSMDKALSKVTCPFMVVGVNTDMLFPVWQQRELAQMLQEAGNEAVTYYELDSIYGHDTFLLDLNGVGVGVKGFLDTHLPETGRTRKRKDH